ncbi:sialate O-acetylesterase [Fulvivirga maritima]|uniref:sialate O-acetylesterase n=1 Tax=Fulvivirga maritima TaxID=2904247 RepID=UPI001F43FA5D|nr:sialate O-acetylesterase [Fulvivirga maritima]UII25334.1 sialate O-acetylesterase [Fulvivirga maritima]
MKTKLKKYSLLLILFIMSTALADAKVKLPKVLADHMVIQRNQPITIWGWADKGEQITVEFNGEKATTKAKKNGEWQVELPAMKHGGPYTLTVKGEGDPVILNDILIGDVWICSGQSNMEMPIDGWGTVDNAAKEIKNADHPNIRLLTVEQDRSFSPKENIKKGEWKVCTPENIPSFSAAGYFFGRKINKELDVPIGLISTNWGGTYIQAWTSWDAISKDPEYKDLDPVEYEKQLKKWEENRVAYLKAIEDDPGLKERWFAPETNTQGWEKIKMPRQFEQSVIGNVDGIVWYRYDFDINEDPTNQKAVLSLGAIDDYDKTYVNGKLVGDQGGWNTTRFYELPKGLLKKGKNTIIIRMYDTGGGGGTTASPEEFYLSLDGEKLSLVGDWQFKATVTTAMYDVKDSGPNSFPSQLYNAMIAPLLNLHITGAIWYQGEANTYEAYHYRTMFPAMIRNWREKWGHEFPFIWAQLANYMAAKPQPDNSEWAELREAQHMALSLPKTGEAVLIDVGLANDIHPTNKQDVGLRLALSALKVAYNKDIVYSGPTYESMEVKGNEVVLSFSNTGSGLTTKDKYGYVRGFAIAGNDKQFHWAKARIEGDKVIVYSDEVSDPKAVRYAWADNPDDANLYNKEGLPASPFRTDSWKGLTEH